MEIKYLDGFMGSGKSTTKLALLDSDIVAVPNLEMVGETYAKIQNNIDSLNISDRQKPKIEVIASTSIKDVEGEVIHQDSSVVLKQYKKTQSKIKRSPRRTITIMTHEGLRIILDDMIKRSNFDSIKGKSIFIDEECSDLLAVDINLNKIKNHLYLFTSLFEKDSKPLDKRIKHPDMLVKLRVRGDSESEYERLLASSSKIGDEIDNKLRPYIKDIYTGYNLYVSKNDYNRYWAAAGGASRASGSLTICYELKPELLTHFSDITIASANFTKTRTGRILNALDSFILTPDKTNIGFSKYQLSESQSLTIKYLSEDNILGTNRDKDKKVNRQITEYMMANHSDNGSSCSENKIHHSSGESLKGMNHKDFIYVNNNRFDDLKIGTRINHNALGSNKYTKYNTFAFLSSIRPYSKFDHWLYGINKYEQLITIPTNMMAQLLFRTNIRLGSGETTLIALDREMVDLLLDNWIESDNRVKIESENIFEPSESSGLVPSGLTDAGYQKKYNLIKNNPDQLSKDMSLMECLNALDIKPNPNWFRKELSVEGKQLLAALNSEHNQPSWYLEKYIRKGFVVHNDLQSLFTTTTTRL